MELIWYCLRLRGWEERRSQVIRATVRTQERTVHRFFKYQLGEVSPFGTECNATLDQVPRTSETTNYRPAKDMMQSLTKRAADFLQLFIARNSPLLTLTTFLS
jgi:hypothetical protein